MGRVSSHRSYYSPDDPRAKSDGWVYHEHYYSDINIHALVNSPAGQRYLRWAIPAAFIVLGWFILHRLDQWMSLHSGSIDLGIDLLEGLTVVVMLLAAPFLLLQGFPSGVLGVLLRLGMAFLSVFVVVPALMIGAVIALPQSVSRLILASNGHADAMTYVVIFGTYALMSLFSLVWIFRRR